MKKKLLVTLCILAAMGASATPAVARRKVIDRIIARVNNEIVTQRQFEREQEKLRRELARAYVGDDLQARVREGSKDLLRDLIDRALMVQKAKDLDISVETDVVKRLDEIRKSVNAASLEDLQKEAEKNGLNWEDFKDEIRRGLLMREVMGREVGRTIVVSREDARKYFEAHKEDFSSPEGVALAQILVSNEKRKPEEAEKRAKEAHEELTAGQKWSEMVKKYSDDAGTVDEAGYIGFMKSGTLAGPLNDAIAKLDVGEYSDPIPIKSGYIILKLLDRRHAGIPKFEEVESRVSETIYSQKMQPALRKYLITLRKESYIFLAPGYVDSGAERPSEAAETARGQ
ncbi:MAG: peptidyl-prolyl cis-trans isomerase [Acidobacteria bacterium]|nr:peptidyl-prolyl cis-trans isomerase [Acidobacteriota bacterium]